MVEQASLVVIRAFELIGQHAVHRRRMMGDKHRPVVAGWVDGAFELFEWSMRLAGQLDGLALLVLAEDVDLVVLDIDVRPSNAVASVVPRVR